MTLCIIKKKIRWKINYDNFDFKTGNSLDGLTKGFYEKNFKWKINNFFLAVEDVFFMSKQMFNTLLITIKHLSARIKLFSCVCFLSKQLGNRRWLFQNALSVIKWNICSKHSEKVGRYHHLLNFLFTSGEKSAKKL